MAKHYCIVGGGLVGLGTARALLRARPGIRVTILEKESGLGRHQSTHNSGVLHCGLYYAPGSAKARLAVRGAQLMATFCREHNVAHEICGKLVVAVGDGEVPRLRALLERGTANGVRNLEWLLPAAARTIEPHVACTAAVRVPEEGIVDFSAVVSALEHEVRGLGAVVRTNAPVTSIASHAAGWVLGTNHDEVAADYVVGCAGLHADRVARMAGETLPCRIVPFRGEYFLLRPEATLVRHLVYPVPDPTFPFLGVHFTRMMQGGVECGPNAVLAMSREGYKGSAIEWRDAAESLTSRELWRFLARYPRVALFELVRSLSKRVFTRSLQRLIPELREDDLLPGGSGVRAQALRPNGRLEQDFLFLQRPNALHVLNAPSPAATASLAIGEEIATRALA